MILADFDYCYNDALFDVDGNRRTFSIELTLRILAADRVGQLLRKSAYSTCYLLTIFL